MKLIYILSIGLFLGVTSPARADDALYAPKTVPQCKKYKVAGVGEVCGYADVEDWKKILRVDAEVVHLRSELEAEKKRGALLQQAAALLQKQVDAYADSVKVLASRSDKLTEDLIALDRKYQDERVKPTFGSPIAWTVAAVSTAILAGMVVKGVID